MENQKNNPCYEEELEIDLGAYARIVWKRKKAISSVVILAIIISLIIGFSLPKVYQATTLLEIGKIKGVYLETPKDVIGFLEQPAVLRKLTQQLNMPEKSWPALKRIIANKQTEKFLQISAKDNQPARAKEIVEVTADLVLQRHQEILIGEKKLINQEIKDIEDNVKVSENRTVELQKEISRLKYPKTEAEGLLAQSYINALSVEENNLRIFQQSLLNKKRELSYGSKETIIASPTLEPIIPIKPNKPLIFIGGTIIGLFVGLFYAFLTEYIKKQESRK